MTKEIKNVRVSRRIQCSLVASWALVLTVPGCGGGTAASRQQQDGGVHGQTYHGEPSGSPLNPPSTDGSTAEEPFNTPFEDLVSQDVPWADMSVRIVGARIERGSDPASRSPSQVYAEFDLALTNKGHREVDFTDRDTWDLMLSGQNRVRPENSLGVLISPTDTAKATLRYPVAEGTTLAGAALSLDGSPRGKLEPERIPLDEKWERTYPLRIDSLIGVSAGNSDADVSLKLQVRYASVDLNDPEGRAPFGMRFVHLDVTGTAGSFVDQNVDAGKFRIVVDGSSYPPVNEVNDIAEASASVEAEVLFTIPKSTTNFAITLNPMGTLVHFPVDLERDAHLVAPAVLDAGR